MAIEKLKRSIFQRILGRPATPLPEKNDFWSFSEGMVTVDLSLATALVQPGGVVRLEGNLPAKILVVHGADGEYRAYENKCSHMGRRVDPLPGTGKIQCCSVGASTYDLDGSLVTGSAKSPLNKYPVNIDGSKLEIRIS